MLDSNNKKDNHIDERDEKTIKMVAVWLIIRDGLHAGRIALQKRADIGGQTYPDICQPTWNGKLEEGESLIDAIKREAKEELGEDFYKEFDFSKLTQFGFDSLDYNGGKLISYNFVGSMTESDLNKVKLHDGSTSEFIYIGKEDLNIIKSKKNKLVNTQEDIVLFDDQCNFLIKFLQSRQYYAFL